MTYDHDCECEWMTPCIDHSIRDRKGHPVRRLCACLLAPVVAVVDINLLKNHRSSRRSIAVCARHARIYFWSLNKQRGNDQYGPIARHREREETRRRDRLDRAMKEVRERADKRRTEQAAYGSWHRR